MPHPTRTQVSLLVMFVFVVLVFGLLAYRSEKQSDRIAANTWAMCRARNVNVDRLNHFYAGMIAIERHNPYAATSPRTIANRIKLYTEAMPSRVPCGKDPR